MNKEMERIMWLHGAYFKTLHNHKGKKLTSKLIDIIDEEAVEYYSKHTQNKEKENE